METAALVLGICAFIFSLLALVASGVVAVIVIGWKNSTHRIEYRQPEETTFQVDAPPEIVDQLPSSPEPQTLQQWMRGQQSQLDSLYDQDLGV